MTTHQRLSPSTAHRYMRCAGSVREAAKYPEPPSGPSAIDGTHTHTLVERCIDDGLVCPTTFVGLTLTDHDGTFVVEMDRAQRAKVAIDYVRERSLCLFKVFSESRVDPHYYTGFHEQGGTVDITIHRSDLLEIADYKDGIQEVDVNGNEQLDLYALGKLAEFKGDIPFKYIQTTIIQPKLALKGLKPITSVTRTVQEVLALANHYRAGATATFPADAPLTPGTKQCKWCPAKGCSARAQHALEAAGVNFPTLDPSALPAPTTTLPAAPATAVDQLADQDPSTLPDHRLREILEAAPLLRQTIEQAEAEALRRLDSGKTIAGLKLVNGRGSQAWNLDDEQIAEKLKGMGVPKDAIYVTKLVTPAQAKKLTWANRKGEQKTLSERQLKTLDTEYISKLGGKLTVALESDPRAAVVKDAAPLFSAVQEPAAIAAPEPVVAEVPQWLQVPAWLQAPSS